MIRQAQVAGTFYPRDEEALVKEIESSFNCLLGPGELPKNEQKEGIIPFFVVPHAGYMYSGPIASWSYLELSKFQQPQTVIILGPNHHGIGPDIAVPEKVETWNTPFGSVEIDHKLIDKIADIYPSVKRNDLAHQREHSIEVQLPFLQYIYNEPFKLIPIGLKNQNYDICLMLGEILAKVCEKEDIVIIASSDLTHYESHDKAKEKDLQVLQAVEEMDTKKLYEIRSDLNVSMCGHGPIGVTIESAKKMGRSSGKILKYATSGDSSGIKNQVVGYGSVVFY